MKLSNILYVTFLFFLFSGCIKEKKAIDNSKLITLSSGIEGSLIDTICFKSCRMIFLETNENSLLKRITRIYNDDNKLFILDASLNKLILFDMDGKYLTDIHKVGNAPSEYLSLHDFCLDVNKKQIILLCDRPYKIMKFDYSGEFIEEKKYSNYYANIITNSNLIYCNKSETATDNQNEYGLVCMDMDMNEIHNYLPMMKNVTSNNYIEGSTLTSTLNDYYTRRFDNNIYQINDGEVEKKYEFDFKEYAFPETSLEKEINNESVKMAGDKKFVYMMSEMSESENYLMFRTNIAIFLLDKKKEKLAAFRTIQNSTTKIRSNSYFSIGNNHKMIGAILKPSILCDIKERIDEFPKFDNFELLKLAEKVEEDDNPILLLYEFK